MNAKRQIFIIIVTAVAGFLIGEEQMAAAASTSPANPSGTDKVGPRIQFDSTVLDFGKGAAGLAIEHNFTFTNTGDQTLEIKDVRPTCGCTIAGAWDRAIGPGKTGIIPIRFTPAHLAGEVVKTVIVLCNDSSRTNIVLQLKGTVWEPVEVNPLYVVFTADADCQTNQTREVRIVNHLERPLALGEPECANGTFQTVLKVVRPGKEFELQITLTPPLKAGGALAPITLKTSYTNLPVINITAYAVVQAAVAATPAQITLSPGPLPPGVTANVTIQNNDAEALTLSKPDVNVRGVAVQVREIDPGRRFALTANFPAGFQIQPGQSIQIQIKTSNPRFPILIVPVFQSRHLATLLNGPADDSLARKQ